MIDRYVDAQNSGEPDSMAHWRTVGHFIGVAADLAPPSTAIPAPRENRAAKRKAAREARRGARKAAHAEAVARYRAVW